MDRKHQAKFKMHTKYDNLKNPLNIQWWLICPRRASVMTRNHHGALSNNRCNGKGKMSASSDAAIILKRIAISLSRVVMNQSKTVRIEQMKYTAFGILVITWVNGYYNLHNVNFLFKNSHPIFCCLPLAKSLRQPNYSSKRCQLGIVSLWQLQCGPRNFHTGRNL